MHYITLLLNCNALHSTLIFTNFKQTKLVHIDIFITAHSWLSYKENSLHSLFLISCFIIVKTKCLCV